MDRAKALGLHNLHQRLLDEFHNSEESDDNIQSTLTGGKQRYKGHKLPPLELLEYV